MGQQGARGTWEQAIGMTYHDHMRKVGLSPFPCKVVAALWGDADLNAHTYIYMLVLAEAYYALQDPKSKPFLSHFRRVSGHELGLRLIRFRLVFPAAGTIEAYLPPRRERQTVRVWFNFTLL